MEGKEVRFGAGAVRALGGDHDGDVERVGQLDARLADAARRADAAHRHVAEQHLRRRRRRLHQHADLRHRRRLRRRHDGRPHAGVPRQEGRGEGDEAGEPGLLWHPLAILVGTAIACYVWATTADPGTALGLAEEPGAARLLRDALRVHVGDGQQRLGVRGARRQHAVLEHLDRRW